MRRHAGPSSVFSLLIVAATAVALHRPAAPTPAASSKPAETSAYADARQGLSSLPDPTPGVPLAAEPAGRTVVAVPGRSRGGPVRKRPVESFTTVVAGERLEDVAFRVYGTEDAARELWGANRDLLDEPAGLLRPGTTLRTPEAVMTARLGFKDGKR